MEDETPPRPAVPPETVPPRSQETGDEAGPRRASVFPSIAPPPPGRAPNHRILFAFVWVAVQAVLVMTAGRRSDGAFGFRMFNESSTLQLTLFREVIGPDGNPTRVHVEEGVWTAAATDGIRHRLSWYDRVPSPFWVFDQEMHASYGANAQLSRLQGALDDVASHLSPAEDAETRRLVLDVVVRRNGREPVLYRLTSHERIVQSGADTTIGGP